MSEKAKIAASMVVGSMLLSGCQTSPHVAEISKPQDSMLTCSQIYTETEQTKQYKAAARANDEFSFRYILIFPAMWNMYEWIVAENAADDRLEVLDGLKQSKNCPESRMGGNPYGTENYPYGGRVNNNNNNPTNNPYGNYGQQVNPYAGGTGQPNMGNIPSNPYGNMPQQMPETPYGAMPQQMPETPYGAMPQQMPATPYGVMPQKMPTNPYGSIPQQMPTNPSGSMPNEMSMGTPPNFPSGGQVQQGNPYNMQHMPAGNIDPRMQPYSTPTTQLPEGRRRPKDSGF